MSISFPPALNAVVLIRRPAAGRLLRDTTGENLPASVVDVRLWEENAAADTSPLKNSTARVKPAGTAHGGIIAGARGILVEARRSEAHRTEIPSQESKEPTTLGGKNIHPCSRIAFEVRGMRATQLGPLSFSKYFLGEVCSHTRELRTHKTESHRLELPPPLPRSKHFPRLYIDVEHRKI